MSWHLDATYLVPEPPLQVLHQVAVTDASIEAGCIKVIPSTRRLRLR